MSAVHNAGAASRGAYVSLSGPTSYAPEELGRYIDAFYLRNKERFDQGDIAMPLLNLLRETAESELDAEARKNWVVAAYGRILEKAQLSPTLSAIALASTPSLIRLLLQINTPPFYGYFSCHDVRYDTGYDNKINPLSVDRVVEFLVRNYSDSLTQENDPASFFYTAHFSVCPLLFSDRCTLIRKTIIGRAFERIYNPPAPAQTAPPANGDDEPGDARERLLSGYPRPGAILSNEWPEMESEQANTYLALFPFFSAAFQTADDFHTRLQPRPQESDSCCFCTIL